MSTAPATPTTNSSLPGRYYLHTGAAAAPRLGLLHAIFGPETEPSLRRAGIRPGMRVADIGCGVGHVTRFLADCVGASGSVSAVDGSEAQLDISRQPTSGTAGRVDFVRASAYETSLPRGAYDIVCCRFLLCHLQRPLDAIDEMRALVRPGGAHRSIVRTYRHMALAAKMTGDNALAGNYETLSKKVQANLEK